MKKTYETIGIMPYMSKNYFTNLKEAQRYARYLSRGGDIAKVLVHENGRVSTHSSYRNKRIVK